MTDETKKLIVELYESASGHIGGSILCAAIANAVEEKTGVKVTMTDVINTLAEHEGLKSP